jgi:hypothetical protein
MIGDYIVVAVVFALGLSFVGIIHFLWLRDAFREETSPLDGHVENEGKCEISALDESSSKAGWQTARLAIQASSGSQRSNREPFDPGATTLVGKPEPEEKMLLRRRMPALSQTPVSGRS